MAVPQTEIENEYMGEARDNALEGVQQTVRETVGKVQDAASSAVGLVTGDQKSGDQKFGNQGAQQGSQANQANQWNQAQRQQPGQSTGAGASATAPGTTANNPSQQAGRQNQPGAPKQPGSQPPKSPGEV